MDTKMTEYVLILWLVKIHCVNHRIELAVKAAFEDSLFSAVDRFYIANFALMKNSGAIKSAVKHASSSFHISHYELTKMTGTRFVSHRRKALTRLLNIWPALTSAYETILLTRTLKAETKGKIQGFLKNLKLYEFLCKVCCYLDILEKITPSSLVFEGEEVMPGNIQKSIRQTILELEDISENAGTDEELLDSHLSRFVITDKNILKTSFVKTGDMLKKPANRADIEIELADITHLSDGTHQRVSLMKSMLAVTLIELIEDRFESFKNGIFEKLDWFDPGKWDETKNYGENELFAIADYFNMPLEESGFDRFNLLFLINWEKSHFAFINLSPKKVWRDMLITKREEFPNLALIAELVICIGGSFVLEGL